MCWLLCWLWTELLFWPVLFKGVQSLQLVALNVPELVSSGEHIRMSCNYLLEGDQLYSIKWYKDDMEFFRYVPTDKPPGQFFPLPGIKIDVDRSLNGTVFIKDVDFTTSGIFRCEVSADAPSFQTVSASKPMHVRESNGCTNFSVNLLSVLAVLIVAVRHYFRLLC